MKRIKILFLFSAIALFLANCAIIDTTGSSSYCGDMVCDAGEDSASCPSDCGTSTYCGDGVCNGSETSSTCATDCGTSTYCGDGVCNGSETSSTCSADCGITPVGTWYTPVNTASILLGACQWVDASYTTQDYCMTNYYEGSCAILAGSGGTMSFSTSAGSTSMVTTSNLCVDNGYTGCYDAGGFLMCGPNYVSGLSNVEPLFDLIRSAYDQTVPQRTR